MRAPAFDKKLGICKETFGVYQRLIIKGRIFSGHFHAFRARKTRSSLHDASSLYK